MSQLYAVRHAQANLFGNDYDQLSAHGLHQSRLLADYWVGNGIEFDQAIIGPCRRHAQTAEIIAENYARRGTFFPTITVRDEFDEHQVDRAVVRLLKGEFPIAKLEPYVANYRLSKHDPKERQRQFHFLFEAMTKSWQQGELDDAGIEDWSVFNSRVEAGLDQILQSTDRGKRIVLVTSVGPLSVLLSRVLRCGFETSTQTGWRIRNSSYSRIVFTSQHATLDQFNLTPHLTEAEVTYR